MPFCSLLLFQPQIPTVFSLILDYFASPKTLYEGNNVVCHRLGLASASISLKFIYVVVVLVVHFFFFLLLSSSPLCGNSQYFILFTFGLFPSYWPLGIKVLWTLLHPSSSCRFIFSCLLSELLGVEWQGLMQAGSFLRQRRTGFQSGRTTYTPARCVAFGSSPSSARPVLSAFLILALLIGVWW